MKLYFLAEKMKCRKTSVGKLMVFMPLFTIIFSFLLSGSYFVINSSNWWYTMMYPGMACLICGVIVRKDKKLKNHTLLTLPVDMKKIWDGKVLYGIWATGAGLTIMFLLLTTTGVIAGKFGMIIKESPSVGQLLFAWVVLLVTFLWQVPFCMFLAEVLGTFPMVLIHMILYNGAFIYMTLKPFYMVLPGGIPARTMCAILKILPNNLLAVPGSVGFAPELLDVSCVWIGMLAALIWFFLIWFMGRKWYERQEGK